MKIYRKNFNDPNQFNCGFDYCFCQAYGFVHGKIDEATVFRLPVVPKSTSLSSFVNLS